MVFADNFVHLGGARILRMLTLGVWSASQLTITVHMDHKRVITDLEVVEQHHKRRYEHILPLDIIRFLV